MSTRTSWIQSNVAPTQEALAAGDGCHPDEASSLIAYLEGNSTAQAAAKLITAPILQEQNPPAELYRLWALLCETLAELPPDREKTVDLLAAIQSLPSTAQIDWTQLPGFGHMWSDLYRLHFQGRTPWESENVLLTDPRTDALRQHLAAIGAAEAEMYRRGIGGVSAEWRYETLNLVCARREGLEVCMYRVHAWVKVAGTKLKEDMGPEEVRSFSRPVSNSRNAAQKAVSATIAEHWAVWSDALLELSRDGSLLSHRCWELGAECHGLMQ